MMRIKTVLATAMLAGTGIALTTPAQAALSDCNSNNMCLWGNNDYKLMLGERTHGSTSITNLTGDRNDEMDSWANRSATYRGCMYEHSDGGGTVWYMAKASNDNNVGPGPSDDVSSWNTRC